MVKESPENKWLLGENYVPRGEHRTEVTEEEI
jgi:hypothetical protein